MITCANLCSEGYFCELPEWHEEEYHQAKVGNGMLTWKAPVPQKADAVTK